MAKKKHPVQLTELPNSAYGLGKAISRFRYDALAAVLQGLIDGLREQAANDDKKGRPKLSMTGFHLVSMLSWLRDNLVLRMLEVSRPQLKKEFSRNKEIKS